MADTHPNSLLFLLSITTLLFSNAASTQNDVDSLQLNKKQSEQKLSHFRLYFHDIVSGGTPTAIPVVKAAAASKTGFGQVNMIDNPLTLGPELSSKLAGKAQGLYAFAAQQEFALLMTMNFVFTYGKYNGSTIAILGRNEVYNHVREMPVIGGSGLFRFARGYVEARTHDFNLKTGDATVEYNVYVLHY